MAAIGPPGARPLLSAALVSSALRRWAGGPRFPFTARAITGNAGEGEGAGEGAGVARDEDVDEAASGAGVGRDCAKATWPNAFAAVDVDDVTVEGHTVLSSAGAIVHHERITRTPVRACLAGMKGTFLGAVDKGEERMNGKASGVEDEMFNEPVDLSASSIPFAGDVAACSCSTPRSSSEIRELNDDVDDDATDDATVGTGAACHCSAWSRSSLSLLRWAAVGNQSDVAGLTSRNHVGNTDARVGRGSDWRAFLVAEEVEGEEVEGEEEEVLLPSLPSASEVTASMRARLMGVSESHFSNNAAEDVDVDFNEEDDEEVVFLLTPSLAWSSPAFTSSSGAAVTAAVTATVRMTTTASGPLPFAFFAAVCAIRSAAASERAMRACDGNEVAILRLAEWEEEEEKNEEDFVAAESAVAFSEPTWGTNVDTGSVEGVKPQRARQSGVCGWSVARRQ